MHVEGMGVVGSFVAQHFAKQGVAFSWNDTEAEVSAWPACTGGIYPNGEPSEREAYDVWASDWQSWAADYLEPADFWFLSKTPPHSGSYPITAEVGPLRRGDVPSFHFNAQRFVKRTRQRFASLRLSPPPGSTLLVAHGFGPRLDHYLWGWHAKVELRFDPAVSSAGTGRRPCLYLRTGRYAMAYAYPAAGENDWYAGSATQVQRIAKPLDVPRRLGLWIEQMERATRGLIRVRSVGDLAQGWRPCPAPGDDALVRRIDGAYHVRPMSHSGVRLAPHLVKAVFEVLGG